jgi:hypothetical protein
MDSTILTILLITNNAATYEELKKLNVVRTDNFSEKCIPPKRASLHYPIVSPKRILRYSAKLISSVYKLYNKTNVDTVVCILFHF